VLCCGKDTLGSPFGRGEIAVRARVEDKLWEEHRLERGRMHVDSLVLRIRRPLGLGGAALAHTGCLLYLVIQLPLPLFFRFVVLV
jgi:hypothetical protein